MACTRFKYDDCRTIKALQQSTDQGRWILNVPGNGSNPDFIADPHIRIQKWGGNLMTNTIDLESSLKGINRNLNRDCLGKNEYTQYDVPSQKVYYPKNKTLMTDESRATHPAWWYRDLEHNNFQYLHLDPQANITLPFNNNISSRIVEKDTFTLKRDQFTNNKMNATPCSTSNLIKNNNLLS
jgi:hypothetical protein